MAGSPISSCETAMFFQRLALVVVGTIAITVLTCTWVFSDRLAFQDPWALQDEFEEGDWEGPNDIQPPSIRKLIADARRDGTAPESVKALTKVLKHPNGSVRIAAAWALGKIGLNSVASLPDLERVVFDDDDQQVRDMAEDAIDRISVKATGLDAADNDADPFWSGRSLVGHTREFRRRDLQENEEAFVAAQEADIGLKALMAAMKDSETKVRSEAILAIGKMSTDKALPAVPALIDALNDAESDVRGPAATVLGRMGKKAKLASTGLTSLLADSDRNVRCAAALALSRIGKDASEAVPGLLKMAKSDDKYVQSLRLLCPGRPR